MFLTKWLGSSRRSGVFGQNITRMSIAAKLNVGQEAAMSEQALRQFRERWAAVAAIEAAERRATPLELRWRQLNAILRLAQELGLPLQQDPAEITVWQRWASLKERLA
jgi:hypothetical protein